MLTVELARKLKERKFGEEASSRLQRKKPNSQRYSNIGV